MQTLSKNEIFWHSLVKMHAPSWKDQLHSNAFKLSAFQKIISSFPYQLKTLANSFVLKQQTAGEPTRDLNQQSGHPTPVAKRSDIAWKQTLFLKHPHELKSLERTVKINPSLCCSSMHPTHASFVHCSNWLSDQTSCPMVCYKQHFDHCGIHHSKV